jgi:O-acetylhomoserine (thiol)-lyase
VYYPGLRDHPQYDLSRDLFRHPGAVLSLELRDDIDVFESMNRFDMVVLSSNLGDNRTLAIPVSHTIYYEMGPERRASMGIDESLIRVSVGIEDAEDLIGDFQQALESTGSSQMAVRG